MARIVLLILTLQKAFCFPSDEGFSLEWSSEEDFEDFGDIHGRIYGGQEAIPSKSRLFQQILANISKKTRFRIHDLILQIAGHFLCPYKLNLILENTSIIAPDL